MLNNLLDLHILLKFCKCLLHKRISAEDLDLQIGNPIRIGWITLRKVSAVLAAILE